MWCSVCQQDVPAVVRSAREALICSRCQGELAPATVTAPSDAGIALDSMDRSKVEDLAPPIDWLAQEQTRQRLRQMDRQLNMSYHQNRPSKMAAGLQRPWAELPPPPSIAVDRPMRSVAPRRTSESASGTSRNKNSKLLSVTLSLGVISFFAGIGLLAWSIAFQLPQLWRQGMTLTIGAEGLLILSLTWMAARLWHNSRRVNRQLDGVDQQLAEIEQLTGTLAGSHNGSSQHYYHHFSQAASPHMLVANLQGQVDQLAARL